MEINDYNEYTWPSRGEQDQTLLAKRTPRLPLVRASSSRTQPHKYYNPYPFPPLQAPQHMLRIAPPKQPRLIWDLLHPTLRPRPPIAMT